MATHLQLKCVCHVAAAGDVFRCVPRCGITDRRSRRAGRVTRLTSPAIRC
jgi:hypothetical protein